MSKRYRTVLPLVVVLAMTVVVAAQPSASMAQEGDVAASSMPFEQSIVSAPAAPIPGGPGFYSQTAIAFQPWPNSSVPYTISGRTLLNPDTTSHAYEAMIWLPNRATITKFIVWMYDNNGSANVWAALGRGALDDSSVAQIARVDSSGAVGSVRAFQDTSIYGGPVDMQNYAYWVEAYLPANSAGGIVSFRIDYSFPVILPGVTK